MMQGEFNNKLGWIRPLRGIHLPVSSPEPPTITIRFDRAT